MNVPSMQILLSTYNGEQWLPALLRSLERQTFTDWQLLVRDDASSDRTMELLLRWQEQHPAQVSGIVRDGVNLGSALSFSRLVEWSSAPYLLFCDQDDVWFPEKLEMQYAALRRMEAKYGDATPILVHSDLAVLDRYNELLYPSFWEYRRFNVQQDKRAYLLTNVVTGCATAFNRAAADLAFPLPVYAIQHDRWLALVCAWFGQVLAQPQPLVLYRQHHANAIGAQPLGIRDLGARVDAWGQQAEAFLHRYAERMTPQERQQVAAVASLRHLRGWQRRRHILQHRLFKPGIMPNLALLLFA